MNEVELTVSMPEPLWWLLVGLTLWLASGLVAYALLAQKKSVGYDVLVWLVLVLAGIGFVGVLGGMIGFLLDGVTVS
jgi:hypothetical protein